MRFTQAILTAFPLLATGSNVLLARQSCSASYEPCAPTGATTSQLPPVGPGLINLYSDLVQAVNAEGPARVDLPVAKAGVTNRQVGNVLCCALTSQCLLLTDFHIQFCWDRFTTNFFFADDSYGSIVAGNYTSSTGTKVNLVYGDWVDKDGKTGNMYSDTPSMTPDTSTMPMPTPWTSTGAGSAIPASELGSSTLASAGTPSSSTMTISAITLPSTTISIGTSPCGHCSITIVPGLTGLPPTGTTFTNGSSTPVSTITPTGKGGTGVTGIPSASSSIYSTSIIIPPFTNNQVMYQRSAVILGINLMVWIVVL